MNNLQRFLIGIGAVVLVGAICFIILKQVEISKRQQVIETQVTAQKELSDNIVRSQKEWATKNDIDNMAKSNHLNLDQIQKDLSKMNASIDGLNNFVAKSQGQNFTNVKSTDVVKSGPGPQSVDCGGKKISCPDPFGYGSNQQLLKLNEQFSNVQVPFGQVGFSSWKESPWDVSIYPRNYSVTTVVGKDDEGKEYVYNKLVVNSDGKDYEIKINNSKYLQQYPDRKISFWNPRLFLGVSFGANVTQPRADFTPSLTTSFISYGRTKSEIDLSIFQLGLSYLTLSRQASFVVNPVMANINYLLPNNFISNTFIGPTFQYSFDKDVYVGMALQVKF